MTYVNPDALVTTDWLAEHLSSPDVSVVDASSTMPGGPDLKARYREKHIPGAVFFDINDIAADDAGDLPHMMPDAVKFASKVRKLGLGDANRIVVYDQNGISSAACRVWWMLRHFGNTNVAVLDGGLPKWLGEDRPVDNNPPTPRHRHFTVRANSFLLRDIDQIKANVVSGREQLLDARAAGRFEGTAAEQWGTPGRIPGSLNLPFTELLEGPYKTVVSADQIAAKFDAAGIDRTKPIVTTCGSGVTACVLALGLYLIGEKDVAVYDGSWAEWSRDPSTEKMTGPAS